jgi:hypothetical protein
MAAITYESVELWHKPTRGGSIETVEVLRAESDGFSCLIRRRQISGGKPEFYYEVHRIGTKKTWETCHEGWATTSRGAKSAVSKMITKLKTITLRDVHKMPEPAATCVECNAPAITQSDKHCKDCDADSRWQALDIPADIMTE